MIVIYRGMSLYERIDKFVDLLWRAWKQTARRFRNLYSRLLLPSKSGFFLIEYGMNGCAVKALQ
jgi:hypothetical protein